MRGGIGLRRIPGIGGDDRDQFFGVALIGEHGLSGQPDREIFVARASRQTTRSSARTRFRRRRRGIRVAMRRPNTSDFGRCDGQRLERFGWQTAQPHRQVERAGDVFQLRAVFNQRRCVERACRVCRAVPPAHTARPGNTVARSAMRGDERDQAADFAADSQGKALHGAFEFVGQSSAARRDRACAGSSPSVRCGITHTHMVRLLHPQLQLSPHDCCERWASNAARLRPSMGQSVKR